MAVQWVYANGHLWITLDIQAQRQIEVLWARDGANWISSNSFRSPVYVDTSEMVLMVDGIAYTIARRSQ